MCASQDKSDKNQCNKLKTKDTPARKNDNCSAPAVTQVTPTEFMVEEDSEKDYNSDDSTLDETFKPKKKDVNFSDSDDQSLSNNSDNESEDSDSIPLSELIKNKR